MKSVRRTPYTEIGIRRVRCAMKGCRRKGYATWQVCADARVFRVLCWQCDVGLNRLVLEWVGDPNVERKMARYAASVIRKVNATSLRPRVVQIRNPRTRRYIKVDRRRGVILTHKRSPGPYANIPIVSEAA